jgi:hypothetical protein
MTVVSVAVLVLMTVVSVAVLVLMTVVSVAVLVLIFIKLCTWTHLLTWSIRVLEAPNESPPKVGTAKPKFIDPYSGAERA